MRYVSPGTIERFLENYRLNEEDFERRPETLMNFMKHMFGPGQGKAPLRSSRPLKANTLIVWQVVIQEEGVEWTPMMLAMMSGGGNMSAILPMMMQQGGGKMDPMMTMMLSQAVQKEQSKKDTQDHDG